MLLEHDAAIDFFIAPLDHKARGKAGIQALPLHQKPWAQEMSASDVGSGGALCALSGLPLDAPGSREGGWLYREASLSPVEDSGDTEKQLISFRSSPKVRRSFWKRRCKQQAWKPNAGKLSAPTRPCTFFEQTWYNMCCSCRLAAN